MTKFKINFKKLIIIFAILAAVGIAALLIINAHVKNAADGRILSVEEAADLEADCILVLGAGVWDGGTPSHMLSDRLDISLDLFDIGASDRILMSGDHGRTDYDEVNVMKGYAVDSGVPSECVFMDHAGFSTYESMYRARDIFQAKRIVIVTQGYHMYRAIYIARSLGLDAYGVCSDQRTYVGQLYRDFREVIARVKDFAMCIIKPEPTYLGDAIPISGDGNSTNDSEIYSSFKTKAVKV